MDRATFLRRWRGSFHRRTGNCDLVFRRRSLILFLSACWNLTGCADAQAPAFSLLGSYFPSWMACAVIGIITAVIVRVLFIRAGIDEVLPWRLFIYVCLALAVAFLTSLLIFMR